MNADQTPREDMAPNHGAEGGPGAGQGAGKDGARDGNEPTFAPSETAPHGTSKVDPKTAADAAPEAPQTAGAGDIAADGMDADAASLAADANAHIEYLESELAGANDKLLRALAEAENVRRRAQRDKEDASKYAIKGFAEDMLRVGDNLSRALAAIDADARKADANLDNLAVGVELVMKQLLSAFERAGVKPIEAAGQRFDPMLHEAMYEIEDASQPAGTVAQVLEQGFTLHGRTLRAAKVGVTKGGPKLENKPENKPDAAPGTEAERPQQGGANREGQQAYEHRSDGKAGTQGPAGHQFDEKL